MWEAEDLVREVWRRWNAGDRHADPELFAEDVEIHSALAQTVFTGYEGIRSWTAEIDDQFERWELVVEEIEPVDERRAIARGVIKLKGRGSGVAMDQPASWMIEASEGKIVRIHNYLGQDTAAAAAREGAGD